MKRMTWVGIAACGCAQLVAADPEYVLNHLVSAARKTMKKFERLEMDLEEYKSLLDNLRPYAERGQIKLVDDDHLGLYIEQMKTCRCRQGDAVTLDDATTEARPAPNHRDLAHEIVTFLRERNGAELRDTFDDMKVRDLRLLLDELALILQHGGRPPNWDPR